MEANRRLVESIFKDAKFVQALGIRLDALGYGWCETSLEVRPDLRQQHGFIHAGVLMTLADHTCGGSAATTVPDDKDVITVDFKVTFLRPASAAVLKSRGSVLRAGKNLIFTEAEITVDRDDGGSLMVAKASSTLAVIPLNVYERR